jgi:hypothetical protein
MNKNRRDKTVTLAKIATIVSELKHTNGDMPTTITVQNA